MAEIHCIECGERLEDSADTEETVYTSAPPPLYVCREHVTEPPSAGGPSALLSEDERALSPRAISVRSRQAKMRELAERHGTTHLSTRPRWAAPTERPTEPTEEILPEPEIPPALESPLPTTTRSGPGRIAPVPARTSTSWRRPLRGSRT